MTNITVISQTEINTINFVIDKIEEVRENINSENPENKSKDDLVISVLDIEKFLNMVSKELKTVVALHAARWIKFFKGGDYI